MFDADDLEGLVYDSSPDVDDPDELFQDITLRPHSYRNYNPYEFRALKEADYDLAELRTELRVIEDGRFAEMLKAVHKMFVPLDADEKEDFADRNPGVIVWMNTWAMLEHQAQFTEYE